MVTLKEIAKECGVSIATVSKALNYMTRSDNPTAERVRQKAMEMGYLPNMAARSLKTNRTYSIGLLFEDTSRSDLTHEYFYTIFNAIWAAAEAAGYTIILLGQSVGLRKFSYLEVCHYRNVDGVLVVNADYTSPEMMELVNSSVPVVTLDYMFNNCSAVVSDNIDGMTTLMQYVYDLGHRRIAYIHGEDSNITRARLASFHQFCQTHSIYVPEEYVLSARYRDPEPCRAATEALLDLKMRPTCILYPDDISILGGIDVLRRNHVRYPQDISIAGYDGVRLAQQLRTTITTIRQDCVQMGCSAVRLLIDRIENPRLFAPQIKTIQGTLQIGDSTGPVPDGR